MEKNNSNKDKSNIDEEEMSKINEENLSEDSVETLNEDSFVTDAKNNNETIKSSEIYQVINGEKDEKKGQKSIPFFKSILANVLDQVIVLAFSGIAMLLFDFIIRIIGYMVVMPTQVLLTIYFIVNCLYGPIMQKTKLRKTIAKKILNI